MAAQLYVPSGQQESRWTGTDEFSKIATDLGGSDQCFGNGDTRGLTLETSFGDDTALIMLRTDARHPQLGNGLLGTLQIPCFDDEIAVAMKCADLNLLETSWTDIPQLGCWHPNKSLGDRAGPAFSSFVPNALYQPGIASHTALWLLQRARWARQELRPDHEDRPIQEILASRIQPREVKPLEGMPPWVEEEETRAWQKISERRRQLAGPQYRSTISVPASQESSLSLTKGKSDLRSTLANDFGLDLKIDGGFGCSDDDPIIVTSPDPVEAASTEMLILRCIGKGRGVLWRALSRTPIKRGGRWLEQVKVETKRTTLSEIVTGVENFYFHVAAADPMNEGLPPAFGFIDPKAGLKLAYEIGWLHLDSVTNNDLAAPGLGYSLAFNAPGVKATVFIYDRGLNSILGGVDAKIAQAEFSSAVADMVKVNSEYLPVGQIASNGLLLRQDFQKAGARSVLALAISKQRFVKLRLTATTHPAAIWGFAEESIEALARQIYAN